ncbi:hypothetical protein K3495_g1160 [Podosphaera aphanis]|nr:hypothetical protein K3495_g1160 [Podosphaera aphanis]
MNSHSTLAKSDLENFNDSSMICETCKLTFETWAKYEDHMLNSKVHSNCCDICLIEFNKYEAYKKHRKCAHPLEQSLNCFACGKNFPRLGALIGHLELSKCKSFSQRQLVDVRKQKQQNYESQKAARNFRDFYRCTSRNTFTNEPLPRLSAVSPMINKRLEESFIGLNSLDLPQNPSSINKKTVKGPLSVYWRDQNSNVSQSNPKLYAKSKAVTSSDEKFEHKFDPRSPGFQADKFFLPLLQKYKCPHHGCMKTTENKNAFIAHLKSTAHRNDGLQCHSCLRYFATATALTQHCESEGVRCKVREQGNYRQVIDIITSGVATLAGRLEDDTIAYASARGNSESTHFKRQNRNVSSKRNSNKKKTK